MSAEDLVGTGYSQHHQETITACIEKTAWKDV